MLKRVLVIDDDPGIREGLSLAFNEHCEVLTAASGAQALGILNARAADLVLLDYCLPDTTGDRILPMIKTAWPSLPIIVVTAYGSETLCAHLFRLGARDYFPKPYDLHALLAVAQRLLALPRSHARHNVLGDVFSTARSEAFLRLSPGMQRALTWIQAHYAEPLSLAGVAKEAAMSPFHFCRTFKATVGVGFRDYVTRLRLDKAKELLRDPRQSVTEVAFAVGFSDLSWFYRAFHRETGQSPTAWRSSRA